MFMHSKQKFIKLCNVIKYPMHIITRVVSKKDIKTFEFLKYYKFRKYKFVKKSFT